MKRKLLCLILGSIILTTAACGKTDDNQKDVNLSGKTVETEYGSVTFGDCSTLAADELVYSFSDEEIDAEIANMLSDYTEYVSKETAAVGDSIEVYMYATSNGEVVYDYTENGDGSYEFELGYEEFGAEFDNQFVGASVGDEFHFTVSYDDTFDNISLAGATVDYEVTVVEIKGMTMPELTDQFVKEELGYDSKEQLRSAVEENLNAYYNSDSSYDTKEALIKQVVEGASFGDYSQEVYDAARKNVDASYESYIDWLDVTSVDEVYEALEVSDEDIENEILTQIYRKIAICGLAKENGLELTDEEYEAGLERYTQLYADYYEGNYTKEDLVNEFGEEGVSYWILEDKVLNYLYENAAITKVSKSLDELGI